MKRRKILSAALPSVLLAHASAEASMAATSPDAATVPMGEKLLTEFWAKIYNPPQDLSAIDRLCTEDFILTTSGKDVVGRVAFKEWVASFCGRIGDMRLTSHEMFSSADGTRVVSRWSVTGLNQGLFGTPADGRPIEFTGIAVWEVRDGRLAHNWVERSAYELAQRLGKA